MKRVFVIAGRSVGMFFEILFALIVIYFIIYWCLSRIPVDGYRKTANNPHITVYLTSNGVHSDFVVPIRNKEFDWGKKLHLSNTFKQDSTRNWIAIGWGDKNFFLKTKNWGDLTVGTALNAVLGLGTGAVHVVQINKPDAKKPDVVKLVLSTFEYEQLCKYIDESLLKKNGKLSRVKNHPYSKYDFFFDSNSSYSMIYTCNSWTNTGLKRSYQKACLWTPFKDGIFQRYGK